MSTQQLVNELLTLPLGERIDVAQALWQSINEASDIGASDEEKGAILEARRRDADLTSGDVVGRSREDVTAAARRVLECE